MSQKLAIIGTGYVGLVSGVCFAANGNKVICIDNDPAKLEKLTNGICTIYEPGLDKLLEQVIKEETIIFTDNLEKAVIESQIIFLCLPTPPNGDGSADLSHVLNVTKDIVNIIKNNNITQRKILVNKSTVPVGTCEKCKNIVNEILPNNNIDVVSNPEFLREGFAVDDALKPERIIVGTSSKFVEDAMRDLYSPFLRSGNPIYFMDEKSSELTKYASNCYLAVKISFMNDLSAYCEASGVDIENIRTGIGSDSRIGKRFLFPGLGYGGSCFPKDVKALLHSAEEAGLKLSIIQAAEDVNKMQIERFFNKILNRFGNVKGMTFSIWGLAFKPNTDDIREAPAFYLIEKLLQEGASIRAYDPEAMDNTKLKFGVQIYYSKNKYDCLENTDALIIATEWNQFRNPDFEEVKSLLKNHIIFDGRNLYDVQEMKNKGFEYYSVGR